MTQKLVNILFGLFGLLALAAFPTRAQSNEEIRALYQEGSAEYALGHFKAALDQFELAYKKRPLPRLLFNIAQCHRQLKEFEAAATTYRSFIRLDPNNPQIALAQQLLAQVEEALRVQTKAQTAPPLGANGPDYSVNLEPPAPKKSAIAPAAPPPSVAVAQLQTQAPPPPQHRRVASWIALGAGGVALGVGATLGILSKSTANDLTSQQHTRAEADDLQSKLSSEAGAANVLLVVGAVLAVAGGTLFVLHY